ncbi:SCP-like protein [Dictyocaulus viviparus]|uniref:SCP-like protein n=1 Tax=Dictyocaulus viviparus TaxID=29172 RepID=A0A0D8YAF0_DICVI|nr:SCP-like protein [Dictyocaulus viviparus]
MLSIQILNFLFLLTAQLSSLSAQDTSSSTSSSTTSESSSSSLASSSTFILTGSTSSESTVSTTDSTCTCPTINPTGSTARLTSSTTRPTGSSTTRRTTTARLSTKPPQDTSSSTSSSTTSESSSSSLASNSTSIPTGSTSSESTVSTTDSTCTCPTINPTASTNCGFTLMSNAYRVLALGKHNSFISTVARGRARNGEYSNENAPPSSRMDLLDYDCGAEQHAFNHVRSCDRQISPQNARPGYSENIHILGTTNTDDLGALQNAIQTWQNELENNGVPSNMIYTQAMATRTQKIITNVTKIIWGNNRYVGCATIRCSGFYFTSCMYKNPVNDIGSSIYRIGAVCAACLNGVNNCNGNIGLCSW